jgi:predicted nucleotidyltransferase
MQAPRHALVPSEDAGERSVPLDTRMVGAGSPFEKRTVDDEAFVEAVREVMEALEGRGIVFLFVGGLASGILGRPRSTVDVDLMIRPGDIGKTREALEEAGFTTTQTDLDWLYKAAKEGGVVVDILVESTGGVYLDDEMLSRVVTAEFRGLSLPLAGPEDLIVMKALAHQEPTNRYWYDALGILARTAIDWDYLLWRARLGARRVLSLLLYAQSTDILVPDAPIRALFHMIQHPEGEAATEVGGSSDGRPE